MCVCRCVDIETTFEPRRKNEKTVYDLFKNDMKCAVKVNNNKNNNYPKPEKCFNQNESPSAEQSLRQQNQSKRRKCGNKIQIKIIKYV